jgi:hypothetical protein
MTKQFQKDDPLSWIAAMVSRQSTKPTTKTDIEGNKALTTKVIRHWEKGKSKNKLLDFTHFIPRAGEI